jgi:flavin-dependent thymidylate synthase
MKIILAGYNVDTDVLADLMKNSPNRADVTPETLSASYARISRDPRSIDELRKAARSEVERSRKSNQAIIFKMGHHSVAEHAVFNFDILGLSRLAIEEVEHFRLCSFTEKSQRYITLENDFVIPEEIKNSSYADDFVKTINIQNELYHKLHKNLYEHILKKHSDLASDPKNQNLLDGWAKEDARYITSLATQGQLGHTLNARNLELLLRRFASNSLAEVRELGQGLWNAVEKVAPSIILFYKANDYDQKTYKELKNVIKDMNVLRGSAKSKEEVILAGYTKNADDITAAAIMHTSSNISLKKCLNAVKKLSLEKKKELFKAAFKYMEFYDTTLRELEYADLTYDMVISASCFAQLKRHRLSTMTSQEYNPELGLTIPQSIKDIGMEDEFKNVVNKTDKVYYKIKKDIPEAATYILTNAHRRRVLFSCNTRELYHISRLREDNHAQWDIRNVSAEMSSLAKNVMPLTMMLICGKDVYPACYKDVFGQPPKLTMTGG